MTVRNFNNVTTIGTLVAPIASSATTITVQNFNQYPSVPYTVTIDRNLATEEICLVTGQATSTLTVVRGYDGTAGQSHAAGSTIEHTAGAIEYAEANSHVNGTIGVHGTTGNLVGSEGAQSIFDKTLVAPLVQADTFDGDAIVAYDPTGTRNLFRGINPGGTDVITIDNTGKVNAAALVVAGVSTLTGAVSANGGVTVPAGKTVAANGGVTTTTLNATGGVTTTTVNASGTLTATGTASTAGLVLAQVAAPAGIAGKGQVWAQSDGGLYARSGTAAAVRVPVYWGSGTTLPASPQAGDTYDHTGLGCSMRYTASGWRQATETRVTAATDRDAIASNYAALLHQGFRVWTDAGNVEWKWNGTTWSGRMAVITQITPVANTLTSITVTFPCAFPPGSLPSVVTSAMTSNPSVVKGTGANNQTATNFLLTILRTDATATDVSWIASL